MASEWARKKAERLKSDPCDCESKAGRKKSGQGSYKRFYCSGCLAAALDAAREKGAQRERWECHRNAERCKYERASQASSMSELGNVEAVCAKASEAARIAEAIAARGPMLAPEGER